MKSRQRVFYTKLAPYYDFLVPPTAERECKFLNEIFQKLGKGKIFRVLDLGCGTGRHTFYLAKMGYKMTGVDLSGEMLAQARLKCPAAEFKKMNFIKSEFPPESFDAAICMWSTIGYLTTKDSFKTFVKNSYSLVKHLLIIDSSNYENPREAKVLEKGSRLVKLPKVLIKSEYLRFFDKKTRIRKESYLYELAEMGKKTRVKDENQLRMWTLDEITTLLCPDFKILKVYGDYSIDQDFEVNNSRRKIIVGMKVR